MWRDQPNILRARHTGSTFYLPGGGTSSEQGGSVPQEPCEYSLPIVNPHDIRDCLSTAERGSSDTNVVALLSRYRVENERLRDQLKAHAVHEALLEQRLHELSARNTALYLQEFRNRESDSALDALRKQLEDREHEVRALQRQMEQQAGRIAAFEEVVSRPSRNSDASPATPSSSSLSSSSSRRTHELLCQILSSMGFLRSVFSAVKHCRTVPHEESGCSRPLQECMARCLQAALRGNQETLGDMLARGHQASCEELALATREEVIFCETSAVQIAAQLLAESTSPATLGAAPKTTPLPPLDDDSAGAAEEESEGRGDMGGEKRASLIEQKPPSADLTASRETRKPKARPTVDDCEVQ
ncbi:hypothetical protein TraAM80_05226 [Trypanosoma rangeli]|uniref:Uncharacterized protein n=1 Tax=Trypanosoma rangeli TaxID=5698 RepID=A0A422NFT6_TRYRA|nr:uncharacterized protein TraAM80_05226 [Trypanosoma rangeli]RNF04331.1 hypothetical protein TraAM80_05226 [Trypanosoma rangeli]|eukprot:RNF04331.1 hypothetical protein TraAM80_05226 [Trypanosoma rangeli]